MPQEHVQELKLLIRSRYAIIAIETGDEDRLQTLLQHLGDQVDLPVFTWSHSKGLIRDGNDQAAYNSRQPTLALAHVRSSGFPAIYQFKALYTHLSDPTVVSLLTDLSETFSKADGVIVLTGTGLQVPEALRAHVAVFRLPPPRIDEYENLLVHLLRDIKKRMAVRINITKSDLRRLLQNLQGLTLMEAEKVLTKAIIVDQALTVTDIRRVIDAKREVIQRDGLLEYYPVEETMADIAGLEGLKTWLNKRKRTIEDPERAREYGLQFPKGLLLLGIPGTGKSLCAKAVAMEWGLPLLKMDPASLYNKYMGETESNFRKAMTTAERMAPVVLWIDEIEKAFASVGEDQDSGTSTRVLGHFLSWLQERQGDVFVVATANDIGKLPPELLRKGRFDEIFFVDLPSPEVRTTLFRIHLTKRDRHLSGEALDTLAEAAQGFSGAEIEQVVLSALHTAFAESSDLNLEILLREIDCTQPLSVTMSDHLQSIREWARPRTVSAN